MKTFNSKIPCSSKLGSEFLNLFHNNLLKKIAKDIPDFLDQGILPNIKCEITMTVS